MGDQEAVEALMAAEADAPACYYGGGNADHVWMIYPDIDHGACVGAQPLHVGCRDCPAMLPIETLLESYLETQRLIETGIAVITGELEQARKDIADAAGELLVNLDDMPPGSIVRKVVVANRVLSHTNRELEGRVRAIKHVLVDVQLMMENGATRPELAARIAEALDRV